MAGKRPHALDNTVPTTTHRVVVDRNDMSDAGSAPLSVVKTLLAIPADFDDLDDVDLTLAALAIDDGLIYNGSIWRQRNLTEHIFRRAKEQGTAVPSIIAVEGIQTAALADTITFTKPTSLEDGDVLFVWLTNDANVNTPAPSGWTQAASGNYVTLGSGRFYHRVVADASTEPATYVFDPDDNIGMVGVLMQMRGVDNTTPINVIGAFDTHGTITQTTCPAIVTTVNNAVVLRMMFRDTGSGVSLVTPAGHTNVYYPDPGQSGVGQCFGAVAWMEQVTAGDTGSAIFEHPDQSQEGGGVSIAIRPSGGQVLAPSLTYLRDVNTETVAPTNGQALVWDTDHWEPGDTVTTHILTFGYSGDLVTGALGVRLHAPVAGTITGITATVGTAPVGAAVIVDINKNGSTIFSTQGNRPTIADGTQDDLTSTPDDTAVALNDLFTLDVDQIGSGTAGADLVVQVRISG